MEAAQELLKMPKIATVRWTRGKGKTYLLGKLAFFLPYRLGWTVGIGAPREKQTGEIMREARLACEAILTPKQAFISTEKIEVKHGTGRIKTFSLGPTAYKSAQSLHCEVAIVDEMQEVEAIHAAESLIGMVAPSHGSIWLAGLGGSPVSASYVFGKKKGYHSKVTWKDAVKYDPGYLEFVNLARDTMPPPEFGAHYMAEDLDMSDHTLVPFLQKIKVPLTNPTVMVTIDWGKRVDETIVLVVERTEAPDKGRYLYNVVDYGVFLGSYTDQGKQIAQWLLTDVEYDEVRLEDNGVGDAASDIIVKEIRRTDPKAVIKRIWVVGDWKNRMLHKLFNIAKDGDLRYNGDNPKSLLFYNDITSTKYRMLKLSTMVVDHSDYISSLLLALDIPGEVQL